MAILRAEGIIIVDAAPTWTPLEGHATMCRLENSDTYYLWNGAGWDEKEWGLTEPDDPPTASDGVILDTGTYKLGDTVEGVTEPGVLTEERVINHDGNPIVHAGAERTATGTATVAWIRSLLSLEDGSLDAFNEWIGTNGNSGDGAQNNFTYYRGFNINPLTGALIDPDKHGFSEGFEFWFEPNEDEIYAEKHLVLTIPGGVDGVGIPYRIDSHTLPVNSPASWSLYHTINTWFLKSSIDGGQFIEFERGTNQITNLKLLASALVQRGISFQMTHDGTNVSLQILPYGAATGKSLAISSWDDVTLPSLLSLGTTHPWGQQTLVQKKLLPIADNDSELGANTNRWKTFETTQIKVTAAADASIPVFQIDNAGNTLAFKLPVSDSPVVDANGKIAIDTSFDDLSHGVVRVFANEELVLLGLSIEEFSDMANGDVIQYNSAQQKFQIAPVPGLASSLYKVKLSQADADNPVATIHVNTYGAEPSLARTTDGIYTVTLLDAFIESKTHIQCSVGLTARHVSVAAEWTSSSVITISVKGSPDDPSTVDLDGEIYLSIETYP